MDRQQIRRTMRQKRNKLSKQQQKQAAMSLASVCQKMVTFHRHSRIALYLPNDGEIDPRPLITQLQKRNIHCYLPVLHPTRKNSLWFCHYTKNTPMRINRFGIKEPNYRQVAHISPWTLSAVLFPLVAYDVKGGRLGMGGGFYDRTFAAAHGSAQALYKRVRLIGLAYHFQQVESLPTEPWDVPLNAIANDQGILFTKKK